MGWKKSPTPPFRQRETQNCLLKTRAMAGAGPGVSLPGAILAVWGEGKRPRPQEEPETQPYLSKNVLVLYYVFVSRQKNIKFPATELRDEGSAHRRCALEREKKSFP